MIGQECLDELADFVGQKARVAAITERAMRGEIAFEPALEERVALLAGLSAGVVDEVIAKRITVTPGARALVHTMRAHGAHTCLVSGGFTLFTGADRGADRVCGKPRQPAGDRSRRPVHRTRHGADPRPRRQARDVGRTA